MVHYESNLTIDYEQKYWALLENHAELLVFLQQKAPLTWQAWTVIQLDKEIKL